MEHEECFENLREIAVRAQFEIKAEAQAIEDYQKDINKVINIFNNTEDEETKEICDFILKTYNEIITDEQNHQLKVMKVYEKITGLKPKED